MQENKTCLSYTVIGKRSDGKLMFLVNQKQEELVFPLTCYEGMYTGLSAVIELMKETLVLKFDQLELLELTNVVINNQRIPLFVFDYKCTSNFDEIGLLDSNLKWKASDELTDTLQDYDISGAPSF